MTKHILIKVDDEDKHERMRRLKEWNGLTWLEVLERGAADLEGPQVEQ